MRATLFAFGFGFIATNIAAIFSAMLSTEFPGAKPLFIARVFM